MDIQNIAKVVQDRGKLYLHDGEKETVTQDLHLMTDEIQVQGRQLDSTVPK